MLWPLWLGSAMTDNDNDTLLICSACSSLNYQQMLIPLKESDSLTSIINLLLPTGIAAQAWSRCRWHTRYWKLSFDNYRFKNYGYMQVGFWSPTVSTKSILHSFPTESTATQSLSFKISLKCMFIDSGGKHHGFLVYRLPLTIFGPPAPYSPFSLHLWFQIQLWSAAPPHILRWPLYSHMNRQWQVLQKAAGAKRTIWSWASVGSNNPTHTLRGTYKKKEIVLVWKNRGI